ncbi:MAG TPA: tetratricopeptide repeat protein, partial [bacterium]
FCEPLFNLGNICYKNGNLKKAEQWYLNALSRCEKKGDIYNNLAYLYMKMNNIIKAIENIQKALSLDPENMEYLDTRAEIYKKRLPSP